MAPKTPATLPPNTFDPNAGTTSTGLTPEEQAQLSGGANAQRGSPIGLPFSGYTAQSAGLTFGIPLPGRQSAPLVGGQTTDPTAYNPQQYTEGQQWVPMNGSPDQINATQEAMIQAGLLPKTDFRPNTWGPAAADAYKKVLAYANVTGRSDVDALAYLAANPAAGASGAARYPLALTNPANMQADFRSAAESLTGGTIDPNQVGQFTGYEQGQEEAARQRYISAKTDQTASYVGAPSPAAAAQQFILGHDQQAVRAYSTVQNALRFDAMLKAL